ncbi:MAG: Uma2 family endonuclease [Egibacteraceae bacterium]
MASRPPQVRYTYDDLLETPDDGCRYEIIDGVLYVTPPPIPRHAGVAQMLAEELGLYRRAHGGQVFSSAVGLYFTHENFVEPDALYLAPEHLDRIGEQKLEGPPDLVVEISSPSTRRRDVTLKRDLYLRFGVRDYWFVDLKRDAVVVFRPDEDPLVLHRGDKLTSPALPGFVLAVEDLLG